MQILGQRVVEAIKQARGMPNPTCLPHCLLAADFRQLVTSSADTILPSALPEPLRGNVLAEMCAVEMDQLHGRIGSGLSGSQIRA